MRIGRIEVATAAAEHLVPLLLRKLIQMNETGRRQFILQREQYPIVVARAIIHFLNTAADGQNYFHFVIQLRRQPIEIVQLQRLIQRIDQNHKLKFGFGDAATYCVGIVLDRLP